MYENLINNWLADDLEGDARALAVEIISAVIDRAREGDIQAVKWLECKRWLVRAHTVRFVPASLFGKEETGDDTLDSDDTA